MSKWFPTYYGRTVERRWYNLPIPIWLAWVFMVVAFWAGDATAARVPSKCVPNYSKGSLYTYPDPRAWPAGCTVAR